MQTHAIVFPAPLRAEFVAREAADPGPEQVLVETTVSLVSTGTEAYCFRGQFEANTSWERWVQYPFDPGYSAVGRVVKAGWAVKDLREGDRVWTGAPHIHHHLARASAVVKLPEGVDDESATWSTIAFVTQTGIRRAEHALGDTAAVIGLGPLGQQAVQYLRLLGLREVLAIDPVNWRLEIARQHGATQAFCGSAADAGDFVRQHTEGQGADVVYDITGHHAVLPLALPLARQFGKVVLIGDTPQPSLQHITQDVLARQVTIIGSHNAKLQPALAEWTNLRQVRLFHQYLLRGQMRMKDLVTHRYRPDQAPEVYPRLLENRADTLGILLDWRPRA